MNSSKKVSIIIPAYNVARYIGECIESILSQSYPNREIIVVNDKSTDDTATVIRAYRQKDRNLFLIDKIKNEGASQARNDGLDRASGDYILFMDADDYLMDNRAVENLVNTMVNNNCDAVIHKIFTENKQNNSHQEEKKYAGKEFSGFLVKSFINEQINAVFNKVYSRRIINQHQIRFDKHLTLAEDLLFNINYFKQCQSVYYSDKFYYFYRTSNTNSITKRYIKNKYRDLMTVNRAFFRLAKERKSFKLLGACLYIRLKNIFSCLKGFINEHKRP